MRYSELDAEFDWDTTVNSSITSAFRSYDLGDSPTSGQEPDTAARASDSGGIPEAGGFGEDSFTLYTREIGHFDLLDAEAERAFALRMSTAFQALERHLETYPQKHSWLQQLRKTDADEIVTDDSSRDELLAMAKLGLKLSQPRPQLNELKQLTNTILSLRDHLVEGNLRLVMFVARRFRDRGVSVDDLVQEGNLGLLRAAIKFDVNANVRFSTYGFWWISQAMRQAIVRSRSMIRYPNNVAEQVNRLSRLREHHLARHGELPSLPALAKLMAIPLDKLRKLDNLSNLCLSFSQPLTDEADITLQDTLADEESWAKPETQAVLREAEARLHSLLETLDPRDATVLRLKYGIGYRTAYSLREIADQLGISKERVRQIVHNATRTLTHQCDENHA